MTHRQLSFLKPIAIIPAAFGALVLGVVAGVAIAFTVIAMILHQIVRALLASAGVVRPRPNAS